MFTAAWEKEIRAFAEQGGKAEVYIPSGARRRLVGIGIIRPTGYKERVNLLLLDTLLETKGLPSYVPAPRIVEVPGFKSSDLLDTVLCHRHQVESMKNLVKRKLKAGKPALGTWVSIGHPDVTMYLADMGWDWLVCDMEHSPYGPETYHFMVQGMLYARGRCMPMCRIPWTDLIWIKKVMDAGATGIVSPRIETKEQAEEMVRLMKYPPWGERGAGPRLAAFRDPDYFASANEETLCVVMIETAKGVENIDDIFSVEGVDACFVGPSDLSLDMGIHRQYTNPEFLETLDRIVEAGRDHGVAPGMHCFMTPGPTNINEAIERGFLFCALNSDTAYLRNGVNAAFDHVKGWKPGQQGEEVDV